MTDTNQRLRAVFFAVIMVTSIAGASIVFSGGAAADVEPGLSSSDSVTFVASNSSLQLGGQTGAEQLVLNNTSTDTLDFSNVEDDDISVTANGNSVGGIENVTASGTNSRNLTFDHDNLSDVNGASLTITIEDVDTSNVATASASFDYDVNARSSPGGTLKSLFTETSELEANDGRLTPAKNVGANATIFQGEQGLTFYDNNNQTVNAYSLERTAGSNEGELLGMPMPTDQSTGTYQTSSGSLTVTVQTARITEFEVRNNNGEDVSDGTLIANQNEATAYVDYNFEDAEDIELTVEDKNGVDVTEEITENDATRNGNGEIQIDPSTVDDGEYTFTVEGTDDLDFGQASQSTTVSVASIDNSTLDLDIESVQHGENMNFTVTGGTGTVQYLVTINESEFAEDVSAQEAKTIFRQVGDYVETGVANETTTGITERDNIDYAYALVQADGSTADGSINTEYINESEFEINLFGAGEGPEGSSTTTPVTQTTKTFPPNEPIYNATLENDGSIYTVGFPGPISGDLDDIFASGTDGIDAIYRFNSDTDHWEQQTNFSYEPDELTAIAIVTKSGGPNQIELTIEFDQQPLTVPGEHSLDTGWNFISASTYDTPETVFNRGTTDQSLVLDLFAGPQLDHTQTVTTFQTQQGAATYEFEGTNPPLMNPFKGYFVYVTDDGTQPAILTSVETREEADTALNATGN